MRCYLIDEIHTDVLDRLEKILTERGYQSGIEKLYWLPVDNEMLLPVQREHTASCGPHCLALEIMESGVRLELLVRAKARMRCECISYLSPAAEQEMTHRVDSLLATAEQRSFQ